MQSIVVLLVDDDSFVNVDGLVLVLALEVHRCHAQQVLGGVVEQVVGDHVFVVAAGLAHVELEPRVERAVRRLVEFTSRFVALAQFVEAEGALDVHFQ